MSKLDDLLAHGAYPADKPTVKKILLELVGEDETRPQEGPKRNGIEQGLRRTRNKLRAQLRQEIEAL